MANRRKSGRRPMHYEDGRLIPDLGYITDPKSMRREAGACGSRGLTHYGNVLRGETDTQDLAPLVVAVSQGANPDIRAYSIPALLRYKTSCQVLVTGGGVDKKPGKQLTPVGRSLTLAISNVFGVSFVLVARHEIQVHLCSSFKWCDDFYIDDQIMEIIAAAVAGVTKGDLLVRELTADASSESPRRVSGPNPPEDDPPGAIAA
jgi:hypothetical protein